MSGKNRRERAKTGYISDQFFKGSAFNERCYRKNRQWIITLALNRFKWLGLPDTCNARVLEWLLLKHGCATIAKDYNNVWFSLLVGAVKDYNVYLEPARWEVFGLNGSVIYEATADTGVLLWDNKFKSTPLNTIDILARELTQVERTLQVNRAQQHTPVIISGPREQQQVLNNFVRETAGFTTAIVADESFSQSVDIKATQIGVPYLGEKLWQDRQNVWNEIYRFLGITHSPFEKAERLITDEALAQKQPAETMKRMYLDTRQEAAENLSKLLGSEVTVVNNDDDDETAESSKETEEQNEQA